MGGVSAPALADAEADLGLGISDGVASITAGTSSTYTITVDNDGPSDAAAGVVLSAQLPAGTTATESEPDCDVAGTVLTCVSSGQIPSGDGVSYQFTLIVPRAYLPLTADVSVDVGSSPEPDPNPANDQATDSDDVEPAAGPIELPSSGAWFGAYVAADGHTGPDRRTSELNFEAMAGRKMITDRQYYEWGDQFPFADDDWTRDQGRTPILSWNSGLPGGGYARWADIAAGVYDAEIDARAQAIKDFRAPIFFAFHHEPKTSLTAGTPAEFIAAWRHIHDRFEADGVTNVTWVLILMAQTYLNGKGDLFYPGDDYVDLVAADGFNWYKCNGHLGPWRSPEEIFDPFHDFAIAHGKPMMIAEWGTGEDPADPNAKAQWLRDGLATFRQWPEVKVVSYYNSAPTKSCARWIDTSAASVQAFAEIGADPYFNPPLPGTFALDITAEPPASTAETTASFAYEASDPTVSFTCSLDGAPAQACPVGEASYQGLAVGTHSFWVRGVSGTGASGYATWRWNVIVPTEVTVADTGFSPRNVTVARGDIVRWTAVGPSQHTVTDGSGMGLFDSGTLDPDDTFIFGFAASGTYSYKCTIVPALTGTVAVPVTAEPASGGVTTTFTITWATGPQPPGFVYDIQILRPGTTKWKSWKSAQVVASATFVPNAGAGTYSFRARLRRPTVAKSSGWSPVASIIVS
jgi:uncharacterized repeat protein (TIGR01451 family)